MNGCDGADNWSRSKADFTIGAFKKLCQKHVNNESHRLHEDRQLGHDKSSEQSRMKFRELRQRRSGI